MTDLASFRAERLRHVRLMNRIASTLFSGVVAFFVAGAAAVLVLVVRLVVFGLVEMCP